MLVSEIMLVSPAPGMLLWQLCCHASAAAAAAVPASSPCCVALPCSQLPSYICFHGQVWDKVMQQVPIRSGFITQLSQAAEVAFLLLVFATTDRHLH